MTTTLLMLGSCNPQRWARADDAAVKIVPSDDLARQLYQVLSDLPERPGEPLVEFFYRVRAALMAEDEDMLRSLALKLPDHEHAAIADEVRFAVPVVVARWARQVWQKERKMLLQTLISRKTTNPPESKTPGRSIEFDALERDLKAAALKAGLAFSQVDHIAYEVALPESPTGDAPASEVGVVVHADVVPADPVGWNTPPFVLTEEGGRLYGRGVLDDKGPLVAAMTALVALKESGLSLSHRARLIIGTSEESAWAGIERYQKDRKMPGTVFVADGDFPVGVGEKGVANLTVRTIAAAPPSRRDMTTARFQLVTLNGGDVQNQVPARAEAELIATPNGDKAAAFAALQNAAAQAPGITVDIDRLDERVRIQAIGKAAHAAQPAEGKNAIGLLMGFLATEAHLLPTPCTRLVGVLGTTVGTQTDAQVVGLTGQDQRFSAATINLGTVRSEGAGICEVGLNLRWPPPTSAEEAIAQVRRTLLAETARVQLEVTVKGEGQSPFVIDANTPLVGALRTAYATITGLPSEPHTVASTTYAKAIGGGAVTFGPRTDDPERSGGLHAANEYVSVEEFARWVELYTFALVRLGV